MKPDDNELKTAMEEAERLRDIGEDSHFLSKSLLYLQQRNEELEKVLDHLEIFLQFGLPVEEHAKLTRLVAEIRGEEHREIDADRGGMGL